MSTLSLETVSFLEGLLHLVVSDGNDTNLYFDQIFQSFGFENIAKTKIRSTLIKYAEKNFEEEVLVLPDSKLYPQTKDMTIYKNLQNHRWISILLLNKLGDNYKIDSEKFFKFIRSTNTSILGNIITIENLDLSYSRLEGDLADYNLSGGKLPHSTFYGNFFGTKFVGADLSYSEIKIGTRFMGSDFSGANLSNLKIENDRATSPFVAHFVDCKFTDSNMTNAVLEMTSFTLSKFYNTNLSGAKLKWADISLTDMTDITIDENTDTKDINLLSTGYYFEWEDVKGNKDFVKAIMNDFNPVNFDAKMREKILHDNPEYQ